MSSQIKKSEDARTANFSKQSLDIVVLEGQPPTEHDIKDYPTTPDVDFRSGIETTTNNLRGGIVRTAATRLEEVAILDFVGEAKVGDLDVKVVIQQDVLRLQISMDDLQFVAVLDAGY